MRTITSFCIFFAIAGGCGPASRPAASGDDDGNDASGSNVASCTPTGPENTPATCSDGIDNDCNGLIDCDDPSCSGIGNCPVCGAVSHPTGSAVPLPDGVCGTNDSGDCSCTTDADCASLQPAGQKCWTIGAGDQECRISYTSTVTFSGFGSTQTLAQPSDILSICVNMSHEWVRDLEIDVQAPSGQILALDKFEGQTCGNGGVCEVFLGNPLNTDGDCMPCTTETGMQYCWTPTATNSAILDYANMSGAMNSWNGHSVLPVSAGSGSAVSNAYAASDPWTNLVGATLNGQWTFSVTDLWPIDAGQLHSWTISFNPAIVQNCGATNPIQ